MKRRNGMSEPAKTLQLRVSLCGTTRQAADVIDILLAELRERLLDADFDEFCVRHQPEYYAGAMREISRHAQETANGIHTLAEFARFYCLDEK